MTLLARALPRGLSLARRHRADVATGLLLFVALGALYLHLGFNLASAAAQPDSYYDVLFGIDTPRVVGDMTGI